MEQSSSLWRPSHLAQPHIQAMSAYVPGTQPDGQDWIKLNTNELPYPPSPRVAEAIQEEFPRLALYPNPISASLRAALAAHHDVAAENVIVGNGSDDLLNLLIRAFAAPGSETAAMTFPSYSLYPVLADIQGCRIRTIEFGREMRLPVKEIASLKSNIFLLTSPNAPTGVAFSNAEIEEAASGFNGIFVVDEAYADFANQSAVALLERNPRIVVTRSFSKSYGLAGLRVGYALAHPEVIDVLDRIRDSYNVNRLSQAGARAALEDQGYYGEIIDRVRNTRDSFAAFLREMDWFVYPSQSNFLFTEPVDPRVRTGPEVAESLFEWLRARQILVRYFGGSSLTAGFLRISVGTEAQMERVKEEIGLWLKSRNA